MLSEPLCPGRFLVWSHLRSTRMLSPGAMQGRASHRCSSFFKALDDAGDGDGGGGGGGERGGSGGGGGRGIEQKQRRRFP